MEGNKPGKHLDSIPLTSDAGRLCLLLLQFLLLAAAAATTAAAADAVTQA